MGHAATRGWASRGAEHAEPLAAEPRAALCALEEGTAPFKHPSAFLLLQRCNLYVGDLSFFAGLRGPRGFFSLEMFLISISSCQETLPF